MKAAGARWAALVAGVLVATSAAAGAKLTKLPVDYVFPRGDGSPGPVTFSHQSHVDAAKPSCAVCHPKNFRILETGKDITAQPLQHSRFEAGAACGACHGKTAFAFDACDSCHRS